MRTLSFKNLSLKNSEDTDYSCRGLGCYVLTYSGIILVEDALSCSWALPQRGIRDVRACAMYVGYISAFCWLPYCH
jgi:hypothetical protein